MLIYSPVDIGFEKKNVKYKNSLDWIAVNCSCLIKSSWLGITGTDPLEFQSLLYEWRYSLLKLSKTV